MTRLAGSLLLVIGLLAACKSEPRSKTPAPPMPLPERPVALIDAAPPPVTASVVDGAATPPGGWPASLTVVVQDPAGQPVPGIAVRILAGTGTPARALSDAHGEVHFDAVAFTLQVIVDDPARPPTTMDAELKAGDHQRIVLPLLDGTRVAGTVVDQAGKPIADAEIEILSLGLILPPRTRTDAAGKFTSVLAEGSWRMKAAKAGKSETWTTLEIGPKQAQAAVTIKLPDAASLVVETDCASKGCAGADADVEVGNAGFSQALDAKGTTTFAHLPIGEATVTVRDDQDPRHPKLGDAKVTLAPAGTTRVTVTVQALDASAKVAGVIVDDKGQRTSNKGGGQLVVEVMTHGFMRRVIAAADGSFTAANLLPGECELSALRVDPKDSMSGANGGRSVTKLTAPATGVKLRVNDFFRP